MNKAIYEKPAQQRKKAQIKALYENGLNKSKIAKVTGISYNYVSLIVDQIKGNEQ